MLQVDTWAVCCACSCYRMYAVPRMCGHQCQRLNASCMHEACADVARESYGRPALSSICIVSLHVSDHMSKAVAYHDKARSNEMHHHWPSVRLAG